MVAASQQDPFLKSPGIGGVTLKVLLEPRTRCCTCHAASGHQGAARDGILLNSFHVPFRPWPIDTESTTLATLTPARAQGCAHCDLNLDLGEGEGLKHCPSPGHWVLRFTMDVCMCLPSQDYKAAPLPREGGRCSNRIQSPRSEIRPEPNV